MKTQRSLIAVASVLMISVPLARGSSAEAQLMETEHPAVSVELSSTAQPAVAPPMLPAALRPATLADNVAELAGLTVRLLNARIVEVFEPHAFLIESATPRYRRLSDQRDRILVLIEGATLRAPAEPMNASPITIIGVARTLFGVRVSAEAPWPGALDADRVKRLQVRAAILATSVQTAEGTELTDRR